MIICRANVEKAIKSLLDKSCQRHPYIPERTRHYGNFILRETDYAVGSSYAVFDHDESDEVRLVYQDGKVRHMGPFLTLVETLKTEEG